jgi:hypothetical protein
MATDGERWGTLTGLKVTYAQRWCSAWADLLFADMALMYRSELADTDPAHFFQRRALWESAVVSYGRCAVSDQKRKIPFEDFVVEVTGDDGLALHERIMDWRHGHAAHRKRKEFESIETVLAFAEGSALPNALRLVLSIASGPKDDDELVVAFQPHIKTLRDAMYEKRLDPLGREIVDDFNAGLIQRPTQLRPADDRSSHERYMITHTLAELGPGASFAPQ